MPNATDFLELVESDASISSPGRARIRLRAGGLEASTDGGAYGAVGGGGFGTDTTLTLPNAVGTQVDAWRQIVTLTDTTVGSEDSQVVIKLMVAGASVAQLTMTGNNWQGPAGGLTLYGGTAAGDDLTLIGTSNGSPASAFINLGSASIVSVNQATGNVAIGTPAVTGQPLLVYRAANSAQVSMFENDSSGNAAYGGIAVSSAGQTIASSHIVFSSGYTTNNYYTAGTCVIDLSGGSGNMVFAIGQVTGQFEWWTGAGFGTKKMSLLSDGTLTLTGRLDVGSANLSANNTVATVLGSLGPTGSHTTVQEWLKVKGTGGADRWCPLF